METINNREKIRENIKEKIEKLFLRYPFLFIFLFSSVGILLPTKFLPYFIFLLIIFALLRTHLFILPLFSIVFLFTKPQLYGKILYGKVKGKSFSGFFLDVKYSKKNLEGTWIKSKAKVFVLSSTDYRNVVVVCRALFEKNRINFCSPLTIKPAKEEFSLSGWLREKAERGFDIPNSELLRALIFGDKTTIPFEEYKKFAKFGIIHIIVISGFHFIFVALLGFVSAEFLLLLLYKIKPIKIEPIRVKIIFSIIFQIFFLLISGMEPPSQRAFFMSLSFLLSIFLGLPFNPINSLFLAGFLIITFDPSAIFDLSFSLSFSTTLYLILFLKYFQRTGNKFLDYFYFIFVSSTIAGISSTPIIQNLREDMVFISPLSPIFNLVFVPIFSLAIILGIISAIISLFFPFISYGISFLAVFVLDLARFFLHFPAPYIQKSTNVHWLPILVLLIPVCYLILKLKRKEIILFLIYILLPILTPKRENIFIGDIIQIREGRKVFLYGDPDKIYEKLNFYKDFDCIILPDKIYKFFKDVDNIFPLSDVPQKCINFSEKVLGRLHTFL